MKSIYEKPSTTIVKLHVKSGFMDNTSNVGEGEENQNPDVKAVIHDRSGRNLWDEEW